jgi:hypothetical protein
MPEELWQAAAAVAREHGEYATAKRLRLNYGALRARNGKGKRDKPVPTAAASFVELRPALSVEPDVAAGPILELADALGHRLTIFVGADADIATLARELWSCSR